MYMTYIIIRILHLSVAKYEKKKKKKWKTVTVISDLFTHKYTHIYL